MPAQLQSNTMGPVVLTLTDRAALESLHSDLPSLPPCVLFWQGWVNRMCCCRVCPLPGEVVSAREGVSRPVLYLLPELDDRGRGVFAGHVERGVRLLELHAVPCGKGPGRGGG